jgi:hypothetical protein
MFYGGNYQGIVPSASWSYDRYSAGASWSYYRMARNGIIDYGVGDLIADAGVTILRGEQLSAGVTAMVSFPTGDLEAGLGMGDAMVMPAAWGTWKLARFELHASAGYSRAFGPMDTSMIHVMSIVEPMNMSELSWSGGGDYAITRSVHAGARVVGGIPVGSIPGAERAIGAGHVSWQSKGTITSAELQAGLFGDPFDIRAVVSTALTF